MLKRNKKRNQDSFITPLSSAVFNGGNVIEIHDGPNLVKMPRALYQMMALTQILTYHPALTPDLKHQESTANQIRIISVNDVELVENEMRNIKPVLEQNQKSSDEYCISYIKSHGSSVLTWQIASNALLLFTTTIRQYCDSHTISTELRDLRNSLNTIYQLCTANVFENILMAEWNAPTDYILLYRSSERHKDLGSDNFLNPEKRISLSFALSPFSGMFWDDGIMPLHYYHNGQNRKIWTVVASFKEMYQFIYLPQTNLLNPWYDLLSVGECIHPRLKVFDPERKVLLNSFYAEKQRETLAKDHVIYHEQDDQMSDAKAFYQHALDFLKSNTAYIAPSKNHTTSRL
jgi:hypothetical protein